MTGTEVELPLEHFPREVDTIRIAGEAKAVVQRVAGHA
jgi:hypothetical protein